MAPALINREMTFAQYMEQALYGPKGYYSSGAAKSGLSGDYFTAPDTGPALGQLLSRIFTQWQSKLGATLFHLVEMGAGEGALAESILRQGLDPLRFKYSAVERSPARRIHLESLQSSGSAPFDVFPDLKRFVQKPVMGCLFANELVDAFPVHRVRCHKGHLEEAYVDGRKMIWGEPSTPGLAVYLQRIGIQLPEDYETEINLAMGEWIRSVAQALAKGLVLIIDYGRPAEAYYAPERDRGTLRGFRRHQVVSNVLDSAEPMDLTADVDFTSLALDAQQAGLTPLAFMELGSFLMQGLRGIEAGKGDLPLTNRAGLKYLLHPEGMGGAFHVLVLGKSIDAAGWVFEANRLKWLGLDRIREK